MGGVAHSHHFDIVCTTLLLGDCRVGTGQRTISIIAGIIKISTELQPRIPWSFPWSYNLASSCDSNWSDILYSPLHLNYEMKTPELSNYNCSWSDFSSLLHWSEWWRIRITLFIIQLQECDNRIRELDSTCGLTEESPNWRMTGWGIWQQILVRL